MDTGSDGCGSTCAAGVEVLSAMASDETTALPPVTGFAVVVNFWGTDLGGKFDGVSLFTGECGTGGEVADARSSLGWAVSTPAEVAVAVVPSLPSAVRSEVDFSRVIDD
jgi:hypothetical protein